MLEATITTKEALQWSLMMSTTELIIAVVLLIVVGYILHKMHARINELENVIINKAVDEALDRDKVWLKDYEPPYKVWGECKGGDTDGDRYTMRHPDTYTE